MDKITRIRREIERLMELNNASMESTKKISRINAAGYYEALVDVENFLDTLSEEPVNQSEDVFKIWGTTEKEYLAKSMDKVHLEMEISTYLEDWEDDEEIGLHLSTDNGCIPIELEDVRDLARHFAKWGAEHLRDITKMIDKSLEEAAKEAYPIQSGQETIVGDLIKLFRVGFIAGAELQKQRIMEEAVEAVISQCPGSNEIIFCSPHTVYSWEFPWKFSAKGLNKGDKVRIIVMKEEEQI